MAEPAARRELCKHRLDLRTCAICRAPVKAERVIEDPWATSAASPEEGTEQATAEVEEFAPLSARHGALFTPEQRARIAKARERRAESPAHRPAPPEASPQPEERTEEEAIELEPAEPDPASRARKPPSVAGDFHLLVEIPIDLSELAMRQPWEIDEALRHLAAVLIGVHEIRRILQMIPGGAPR